MNRISIMMVSCATSALGKFLLSYIKKLEIVPEDFTVSYDHPDNLKTDEEPINFEDTMRIWSAFKCSHRPSIVLRAETKIK